MHEINKQIPNVWSYLEKKYLFTQFKLPVPGLLNLQYGTKYTVDEGNEFWP